MGVARSRDSDRQNHRLEIKLQACDGLVLDVDKSDESGLSAGPDIRGKTQGMKSTEHMPYGSKFISLSLRRS